MSHNPEHLVTPGLPLCGDEPFDDCDAGEGDDTPHAMIVVLVDLH